MADDSPQNNPQRSDNGTRHDGGGQGQPPGWRMTPAPNGKPNSSMRGGSPAALATSGRCWPRSSR